MIWTRVVGHRVKSYLDKYDKDPKVLAQLQSGKRGTHDIITSGASRLSIGDVVQIEWYNKEGEKGSSLDALYDDAAVQKGSHHWNYPSHALDQHSGANHQNLFDNIKVYVTLPEGELFYLLIVGGGAGYWKPSHGAFSTFWNIDVHFNNGFDQPGKVLLNGMKDGPSARLIGLHANREVRVEYGPNAYIEGVNIDCGEFPSLFKYQLNKRIENNF